MTWKISIGDNLLYKQAGTPALDLRFATEKNLTDFVTKNNLVTFTRTTTATYVDAAGVIQTAAIDEPRFDYDPETGESLGLLVEESRTNLLLHSQDFSSTWNSSYGTLTLNAAVSPDGTSNDAALFQADGVATNFLGSGLYQTFSSISEGTLISFSVFVKNNNAGTVRLAAGILNNRFYNTVFDFSTSSFVIQSGSIISTKKEDFSNGWMRLSFTTNYDESGTARFSISPDSTNSVYLYGAQIEIASFPTSYIPTAGVTVTRAADVAEITGANFSSWYNQSKGTTYSKYNNVPYSGGMWYYGPSGSPRWWTRNELSNGVRTQAYDGIAASGVVDIVVSGSGSGNIIPSLKHIVTIDNVAQEHAGSANGSAVVTGGWDDTTGVSVLTLGRRNDLGGNIGYLNGHISRLTYWPTRLSDVTLQAITAP